MVRNIALLLAGFVGAVKHQRPRGYRQSISRAAAAILLFVVPLSFAATAAASTSVPPIVVSSVDSVPTSGLGTPGGVQLDACNNIYEFDGNGSLYEIPAAGGAAIKVPGVGGGQLGIDASRNFIYITAPYNTGTNKIPIVNCVPQPGSATKVGGGVGALSYYYNPAAVAGDAAGNTFISTNGTCCVTGNFYLIEENSSGSTGTILLSNTASEITSIAVDLAENVYFISAGAVYKLAYTAGAYATTPTAFGSGYTNPIGLSVDPSGNLYVADQGSSTLFKIPYETTTTNGTTVSALNLADQYPVATGLNIGTAAAIDGSGNAYFSQATNSTAVQKLTLGSANFRSSAIGQAVTRTLNFQFNASTTPAAINLPTGAFAGTGGTCVAGQTYAADHSCTVTLSYTPSIAGTQSSAVVLASSTGTPLAIGYLEGVGQGASISLDPGNVTAFGTGLKTPASIAVDAAGNVYIADTANNAVEEFPAGGGAAISLGSKLSGPLGVAVDAAGNVFVADSGNNQVVEIPVVSGALSSAAQTVVAAGLKSPAGVFVDPAGNLYITDTGDNTVVFVPNLGGYYGASSKMGTGLNAPLSTAVDSTGGIYIADSGNNQVVKIPAGGAQQVVAAGLSNPSALAIDASNSLFVVDQGNNRVLRIPSESGVLNPNDKVSVGIGIATPYGLAIDPSASLYVTDTTNAAAYEITRTQVAEGFGDWKVGSTSAGVPVTIESDGNLPLIFNSPYFVSTGNSGDFAMTSPSDGCDSGGTLGVGTSCEVVTTFSPTATGARAATLAISSNATDSATPSILLSGNGTDGTVTTTTLAIASPASGAPFYGEPISITATVAPASGTGTPTGSVAFVLDGIEVAVSPVSSEVATLSLNSGLTGGAHTIVGVYRGDTTFAGSSTAVLAISISKAPTTTTLAIASTYSNPTGALAGTSVTFTATIASVGVGIPSNTVSFFSDGILLATVPVAPAAGGTFTAQYTTSALAAGTTAGEAGAKIATHQISATYAGDVNYLPSSSAVEPITISTGPSFTLSTSGSSITTVSGQTPGSITITLSSLGGWYGVVDFTCTGLPSYAECKTYPGQATVYSSTPAASTLPTTVVLSIVTNVQPLPPTASSLLWAPALLLGLMLLVVRRRFARNMRHNLLLLFAVAILIGLPLMTVSGCGTGTTGVATPTGTSNVTVTVQGAQYTSPTSTTFQQPDPSFTFPITFTAK